MPWMERKTPHRKNKQNAGKDRQTREGRKRGKHEANSGLWCWARWGVLVARKKPDGEGGREKLDGWLNGCMSGWLRAPPLSDISFLRRTWARRRDDATTTTGNGCAQIGRSIDAEGAVATTPNSALAAAAPPCMPVLSACAWLGFATGRPIRRRWDGQTQLCITRGYFWKRHARRRCCGRSIMVMMMMAEA